MAIALLLVGVALMVGPAFLPGLGFLMKAVISGIGLVLFLCGLFVGIVTMLWRKTSADEAFVITGGSGGSRVILDSGAFVIPTLHNIVPVNLKTMKLGVNPHGTNALITRDNLRSDILAQFYIRVQADPEHILNAARSLGDGFGQCGECGEVWSVKSWCLLCGRSRLRWICSRSIRSAMSLPSASKSTSEVGFGSQRAAAGKCHRSPNWTRRTRRSYLTTTYSMPRASARSPRSQRRPWWIVTTWSGRRSRRGKIRM